MILPAHAQDVTVSKRGFEHQVVPGDRLRISVVEDKDLSKTYAVAQAGGVSRGQVYLLVQVEKEWEEQAIDIGRKGQEYRNIIRHTDHFQNPYDLVFNQIKEIDISVGIEPESVRIVERAKPCSSPVTPRKLQSLFMAALIGLALVFGLEYIDDSFRFPDESAPWQPA